MQNIIGKAGVILLMLAFVCFVLSAMIVIPYDLSLWPMAVSAYIGGFAITLLAVVGIIAVCKE